MSDTVKTWIEERRAIHTAADTGRWYAFDTGVGSSAIRSDEAVFEDMYMMKPDKTAVVDAHNMFPRALDALNKVLEQVERMEIDAKTYGAAGHDCASESLATYAGTLRQAIEGAIND